MSIFTKFFRGERLTLTDMTQTARGSLQTQTERSNKNLLLTEGGSPSYVLWGMKLSFDGGQYAIVADGALLGPVGDIQGQVGLQEIQTNLGTTNYSTGYYNVWARLELRDTDIGNRPAWNELATAAPVEFTRAVPTREDVVVGYTIEAAATDLASAGWTLLGGIHVTSGTVDAATDKRVLFVEGDIDVSPKGSPIPDWGDGTNDRSNERGDYGLTGIRQAFRAVFRRIGEMTRGNGKWWAWDESAPTGGSAYADRPMQGLLARDGDRPMVGILKPDTTLTRDIGTPALLFDRMFADSLYGFLRRDPSVATNANILDPTIATWYEQWDSSTVERRLVAQWFDSNIGVHIREYVARATVAGGDVNYGFAKERTHNAYWASNQWNSDTAELSTITAGTDANSIVSLYHNDTSVAWSHSYGPTAWILKSIVPAGTNGIAAFNDSQIQFSYGGAVLSVNSNPVSTTGLKNLVCAKNTCKAWVSFILNNPGSLVVQDGVNVLSVTRTSTAIIITFTEPLNSTSYSFAPSLLDSAAMVSGAVLVGALGGRQTNTLTLELRTAATWVLENPSNVAYNGTVWGVHVFGAQS